MSVKTQGTRLYFAADTPAVLMRMTCPTGISGLGGAKTQIPTTCLEEEVDETFESGLGQPGTVSVPFVFKPSEASQQALMDLNETGETIHWLIAFSDGKTEPALDEGAISPPEGRTSAAFKAYIADITIDISTNEVVRGTMELQRSGRVNWNWKS